MGVNFPEKAERGATDAWFRSPLRSDQTIDLPDIPSEATEPPPRVRARISPSRFRIGFFQLGLLGEAIDPGSTLDGRSELCTRIPFPHD